jgi:hypothetical protein
MLEPTFKRCLDVMLSTRDGWQVLLRSDVRAIKDQVRHVVSRRRQSVITILGIHLNLHAFQDTLIFPVPYHPHMLVLTK